MHDNVILAVVPHGSRLEREKARERERERQRDREREREREKKREYRFLFLRRRRERRGKEKGSPALFHPQPSLISSRYTAADIYCPLYRSFCLPNGFFLDRIY